VYSRARVNLGVGVERSSCGCVVLGRRGVLCVLLQGVGFPGLVFRFRFSAFVCLSVDGGPGGVLWLLCSGC
jgi:hypothetical protein